MESKAIRVAAATLMLTGLLAVGCGEKQDVARAEQAATRAEDAARRAEAAASRVEAAAQRAESAADRVERMFAKRTYK
jgi:hypothetical protein